MSLRVLPIVDAHFGLDGGAMYGIVPRPLWEKASPPDSANRIRLAARALLVEFQDRRVLIDAGIGDKWSERERGIYRVEHPTPLSGDGSLRAALRAASVDPDSVTDVILSHLHFDHAGGLTWFDSQCAIRFALPRATHWVQRENWLHACNPTQRDAGSYRRENFAGFGERSAPPLQLVDGPQRLFDSIDLHPTRGHTPGMQLVSVPLQDRTLIFLADMTPTLGHLPIPWVMGYDCFPLTTVSERVDWMERLVSESWVIALSHDPDVAFATLRRTDTGRASPSWTSSSPIA